MRSPRDRLIYPLFCALTVMWLAAGFTVLFARNNSAALEVFLASTTLEGMVAAYVLGVPRLKLSDREEGTNDRDRDS